MDGTLKEISTRLGLSPSTISRALSGRVPRRASTRAQVERIRALAEEMGYEPNGVARSLKTRRRQVVGLILPDIMNDYYAAAATLVQSTLDAEGYRMLLCVTNDDTETEDAQMRMLREERVAGVVAVPGPRRGAALRTTPALPLVQLVRHAADSSADAVLIDDLDAGARGATHLLELGHRRIAVITGPLNLSTARSRLDGYLAALGEYRVSVDASLIASGQYRRGAAHAATLDLLARADPPTALIATSNELAIGVLQAIELRAVRVPEHLSVVGFGNPDWFSLLRPGLTTVALPIEEMAMNAVHLLLRRVKQQEEDASLQPAPRVVSRYQAQLIVRHSTRALSDT